MSPFSLRQPSLSGIPEQMTDHDEGEMMDSFEVLASEPSPGARGPWPVLKEAWTCDKPDVRRSTVVSKRRATMQIESSKVPTQNFFDLCPSHGQSLTDPTERKGRKAANHVR